MFACRKIFNGFKGLQVHTCLNNNCNIVWWCYNPHLVRLVELLCLSLEACRSIVDDATWWRFFKKFYYTWLLQNHIFIKDIENFAIVIICKQIGWNFTIECKVLNATRLLRWIFWNLEFFCQWIFLTIDKTINKIINYR